MSIIKALILGIVQGLTEFLPVSSSGHISVVSRFFGIGGEASGLFSAMLHIGTLVAIFVAFYRPIYDLFIEFFVLIRDILTRKFTFNINKMSITRRMLFMFIISCVPLLFLLIPVGGGNSLKDAVEVFSTDDSILAEGICFMITGFMLLLGTTINESTLKYKQISPLSAFLIGIAQAAAACFPGISRSGSTISTGMCCKVSKENMIRYSFILSIPAVLAAGLIEFKDAMETEEIVEIAPLIVGIVAASVVGVLSIRLLQLIMKKNKFRIFGYYCMALGCIVTVIGFIENF